MMLYDFLNSSLFQTIIIFSTGLVALILHKIKQKNEKRNTARIVLNEIRYAEKAIKEIRKTSVFNDLGIILQSNTWIEKRHLFLNDFDRDQVDLLNDFYTHCHYAEEYRKMHVDIQNDSIRAKACYLQKKLIDISEDEKYEEKRKKLIEKANNEGWIFDPNKPKNLMDKYINNITFPLSTEISVILKK